MELATLINFDKSNTAPLLPIQRVGPGSSTALSPLMPFFAGFTGTTLKAEGVNEVVLTYDTLVRSIRVVEQPNTGYPQMFNDLSNYTFPKVFKNKDRYYEVIKGSMYEVTPDGVKYLFCLAIEPSYLWKIDKSSPDYSKFVLLVNNDFVSSADQRAMYNRIEKDYFSVLREGGVDMTLTSSIENKCFVPPPIPKFKKISDMNQWFKDLTREVLTT